jgi:hypothetical protein
VTAPVPTYTFNAEVVNVHDGDTQWYRLDLGKFPARELVEPSVRVRGLYCPELDKPGGPEARDHARRLLDHAAAVGDRIRVQTVRPGTDHTDVSFARVVGDVWLGDVLLAVAMIADGFGTDGHDEALDMNRLHDVLAEIKRASADIVAAADPKDTP